MKFLLKIDTITDKTYEILKKIISYLNEDYSNIIIAVRNNLINIDELKSKIYTYIEYIDDNFIDVAKNQLLTHNISNTEIKIIDINNIIFDLEYKDKKIYDVIMLNDELSILDLRLETLSDIVDYHIIIESTKTFTFLDKKLNFNKNKQYFYNKYGKSKILYYIIDDFEKDCYPVDREIYQRNYLKKIISDLNYINETSLFILSDVDEIPNPLLFYDDKIKKYNNIHDSITLFMDLYYYNLHCKLDRIWDAAKIIQHKDLRTNQYDVNKIRWRYSNFKNNQSCGYVLNNCGWHLSYFGDENFIKNKLKSFSHTELNNKNIIDNLNYYIKNNINFTGNNENIIYNENIDYSLFPKNFDKFDFNKKWE